MACGQRRAMAAESPDKKTAVNPAEKHCRAAFKRLAQLLESKDEKMALAVAQEILNRAYGRPDAAKDSKAASASPTVVVVREYQPNQGEAAEDGGELADS